MTLYYGAWEYSGGNGMRVAIDITSTGVSHSSSSVTYTVKIYTQNQYHYNDPQVLSYGGNISGSTSYTNSQGSNSGGSGLDYRATKTYTYNYGSTSFGSSPGNVSFSASVSGTYNGVTPSVSKTLAIPARPYGAPAAPTSVVGTRNSDAQATVTWVRHATSGEPYTSQTVQMRTYTGSTWSAWSTIATASSTATSYVKTGLSANRKYQFQVRSNNSVGSSAFVASSVSGVAMTPGAPSSASAAIDSGGSQINVSWVPTHYADTLITMTVERSVNGGAWTVLSSTVPYNVSTYNDTAPGGGANQYRIKAVHATGTLASGYATSNTVSTIVPPLAPTTLSPNGSVVDMANNVVRLSWRHNPGGDGAAQSHFTIQYSADGGGTWSALVTNVASTNQYWDMPAGTLGNATRLWRVATEGVVSAGFGPYSANATLVGSTTPTVTLDALIPGATTTALPMQVAWTYNQDESSPQAAWEAKLYAADGVTLLESLQGSDASSSATFSYSVQDQVSYVLKVRAQSAAGLWSAWASETTMVNLPVPAEVIVDPGYQETTGSTILHLDPANPLPAPAARTNWALDPTWHLTSGTVEVRRNYITDPELTTATGWSGVSAGGVVTGSAPYSPNQTAAVGETWTASIEVAAPDDHDIDITIYVRGTTGSAFGGNTSVGTAYHVTAGTTVRIKDTLTLAVTGATPDGCRMLFSITGGYTGVTFGKAMLEKAGADLGYFSGDSDPVDGLTFSWAAGANASASIATGPAFSTNTPFTPYTGTSGVVGWQSAPDTIRLMLKNPVPLSGILGFTSGATVPTAPGEFWAARLTSRLLSGQAGIEVHPKILAYTSVPAALNTLAETAGVDTVLPTDGSWVDSLLPSTAAAAASAATARFIYYTGAALPAGTVIEVKQALMEKVSGVGVSPGSWFAGDSPADPTMTYAWFGTAYTTRSVGTGRNELPVASVILDRRVDGGDWVTLASGITVPNDFVDPLPATNGITEYRVTSVSTAPSYRVNDSVLVAADNGSAPGSRPETQWVFLNYGDGFGKLVRFRSTPEIKESAGRQKSAVQFLGRRKPVLMLGSSRSRQVDIGGQLVFDASGLRDDEWDWDSPPDDWRDAAQEAEVVCLRDFTGRRVFGALSDLATSNLLPNLGTISFSVTEVDYTESYGVS
jgi:hypothetical protein